MDPSDFCILILTHGHADSIITVDSLRRYGCTSEVILVIDDEDDDAEEYIRRFDGKDNCKVHMFNKREIAERTDVADIIEDRKSVVFARNVSFDIAKEHGYTYFVTLEDDYHDFWYRRIEMNSDGTAVLRAIVCRKLDKVFGAMLDFVRDTPILTACLSQMGDFIGGAETFAQFNDNRFRKAMNVWFSSTEKPFQYFGRLNDDVNTYTLLGSRGETFITVRDVCLKQDLTQQGHEGGLSEVYKKMGTYAKSFYSVMMCPSCVKISMMGMTNMRIHHEIKWDNAVPKILSQRYKKSENRIERIPAIDLPKEASE